MSYTRPATGSADATWLDAPAYTRPADGAADASFVPITPQAIATAASPLGAPAVLGGIPLVDAWAAAPSPLSPEAVLAWHDFTAQLDGAIPAYVMDLTTPGGAVRVPISSWQATLQTGASNYVQCVVPGVADWAASINAATEFTIWRTATPEGGPTIEYEMARAPLQTASYARGTSNFTCTLSGYSTAFAEDEAPDATYDRTLSDTRSITTGSGRTRVRCAIDWLLRPGHRAFYDGEASLIVAFINYYMPQGSDAYMDVGD